MKLPTFIDMLFDVYKDFGFEEVIIKLATRPENRVGDDAVWDNAEDALELASITKVLNGIYSLVKALFMVQKLNSHLKDCIGRMWQCGTLAS